MFDVSEKEAMEVLYYLREGGKITIDDVLLEMNKMNKENILRNHPYSLSEYSDGRWKTYVNDRNRPGKRKQLVARSKADLEEKLFAYYDSEETNSDYKNISFAELFVVWLKWKGDLFQLDNKTIRNTKVMWDTFISGEKISNAIVRSITTADLKTLLDHIVSRSDITTERFLHLKGCLNGVFSHAVSLNIREDNPFSKIEALSRYSKLCKPTEPKDNFTKDDRDKILTYLHDSTNIMDIAICFAFYSCLRVGELASIKKEDLTENHVYIHRMLHTRFELDDDFEVKKYDFEVEDRTKSRKSEGLRRIPLTSGGKEVVKRALVVNPNGEYLFKSVRTPYLTSRGFNKRLKNICKKVDVPYRSSHQIRFTIATLLHEAGVPINQLSIMLGHSNVKTTLHYLRQNKPDLNTANIMESALSSLSSAK